MTGSGAVAACGRLAALPGGQAGVAFTVGGSVSGNFVDPGGFFPTGCVAAVLAISTGQPLTDASAVALLPVSTTVQAGAVLDIAQAPLDSGTVGPVEEGGLHTVTAGPFPPNEQDGTLWTTSRSDDPGDSNGDGLLAPRGCPCRRAPGCWRGRSACWARRARPG